MRLLLSFLLCCTGLAGTSTIQESGGDYDSLLAWEDAKDANLTGAGPEIAVIQGGWTGADPDGAVSINGWTTTSSDYIVITNSTSKHDGKRYGSATTAYRMDVAGDCITIVENYVRIYGLQINVQITSAAARSCIICSGIDAGGSDVRIGNCIVKSTTSSSGNVRGIQNADADCTLSVFNCIAYDFTSGSGYAFYQNSGTSYLYNCLAFTSDVGYIRNNTSIYTYNCIAQDCTDGWSGSNSGADYNRSDIGSDAPGTNSINDTDDVLFVSTSAGTEDFHLSASEVTNPNATSMVDRTSDLSSGLFVNDIDYSTRSGAWEVGPDEYVSAGTVNPQVIIITQ